jgi:hypothetical protein
LRITCCSSTRLPRTIAILRREVNLDGYPRIMASLLTSRTTLCSTVFRSSSTWSVRPCASARGAAE